MGIDNKIRKSLHAQAVILKSVIKGYGEHGFKITPYPFKNFTMKQSLKHHIKAK
ncbi:hypothetical protein HMPREF1397_01707 [Helicobacter pylori GAM115Ai]|nr:hypothetical protein HMPREF1397_01707 [Helicobacter pylori GAM115Ai]EMG85918.1 hypothetical protein HMPREF1395_01403 [Helicobacter pylori GAM112Ai]EMH32512.1 hypothetical protein HMPREF1424_01043 [Helicobacter pylori GAM42Ai]